MYKKTYFLLLAAALIAGCTGTASIPEISAPTPTAEFGNVTVIESQATAAPGKSTTPTPDSKECDNPFYPVSDGATWTYDISSGGSAVYTMSADDTGAFVIDIQSANDTFTVSGQCSVEGIVLMEVPGSTTTYSGDTGTASVVAVNESGVTLPHDIGIGQEWAQKISATTSLGNTTIESYYTAIGFENITVPAGEFYVLKVEQSGNVQILGQSVNMHGYHWYAEGVGVVRSAMDGAPTVELASYDIPE